VPHLKFAQLKQLQRKHKFKPSLPRLAKECGLPDSVEILDCANLGLRICFVYDRLIGATDNIVPDGQVTTDGTEELRAGSTGA
jgi:hypothetical protein